METLLQILWNEIFIVRNIFSLLGVALQERERSSWKFIRPISSKILVCTEAIELFRCFGLYKERRTFSVGIVNIAKWIQPDLVIVKRMSAGQTFEEMAFVRASTKASRTFKGKFLACWSEHLVQHNSVYQVNIAMGARCTMNIARQSNIARRK